MLGLDFVNYMQKWQVSHYVSVEDFADKFNSLFTTLLLILSALVISAKQYVFQPLSCYCSKSVSGKMVEYMENYCWTTGTHKFDLAEKLPRTTQEWDQMEHRRINYYQWVPFVLALQCAMYYLPHLFWLAMVTNRLGSDAQYLVTEAAGVARETSSERRGQLLTHLARSVLYMQSAHRQYSVGRLARLRARLVRWAGLCFPSKRLGTALVFCYFVAKLMYLANCLGQLGLMHRFLELGRGGGNGSGGHGGGGSSGWAAELVGWDLISSVYSGRDWHSGLFPRSSLCRVRMHSIGFEVVVCQCALPVNMLNEKIYLMLWLWTLAATLITAVSIPIWLSRIGLRASRRRFIRRQLLLSNAIPHDSQPDRLLAFAFADELLHQDGVFLFKMMQLNAGDVVTGQVLRRLFELWQLERASPAGCCGDVGGGDEVVGSGDKKV